MLLVPSYVMSLKQKQKPKKPTTTTTTNKQNKKTNKQTNKHLTERAPSYTLVILLSSFAVSMPGFCFLTFTSRLLWTPLTVAKIIMEITERRAN